MLLKDEMWHTALLTTINILLTINVDDLFLLCWCLSVAADDDEDDDDEKADKQDIQTHDASWIRTELANWCRYFRIMFVFSSNKIISLAAAAAAVARWSLMIQFPWQKPLNQIESDDDDDDDDDVGNKVANEYKNKIAN